jgi:hypothetical protein
MAKDFYLIYLCICIYQGILAKHLETALRITAKFKIVSNNNNHIKNVPSSEGGIQIYCTKTCNIQYLEHSFIYFM